MFFRLDTDQQKTDVELKNSFAGPSASSCWLIGGGPSLGTLPIERVINSPAPIMSVNLAGSGLLRPNFWTAYDPTVRFHRSIYLDAGVMKFVHRRRARDIVPETTFKVCDCPNLYFFTSDHERTYRNLIGPQHNKILDWADSLLQAIDILYQLGFRIIFLAGCELRITPSSSQQSAAMRQGIDAADFDRLRDFIRACESKGIGKDDLSTMEPPRQYHFAEQKPLGSVIATDEHYFRVVQYLRLARRNFSEVGLQLISVTPGSRLNHHFPSLTVEQAIERIHEVTGDPHQETTQGRYTNTEARSGTHCVTMQDFKPFARSTTTTITPKPQQQDPSQHRPPIADSANLPAAILNEKSELTRDQLRRMRTAPVLIQETG